MDLPAAIAALEQAESTLGLAAGTVEVADARPEWARLYDGLEAHLLGALTGLDVRVEHIGSTSVPGLAAKPVLDIAIGARQPVDNQTFIDRLEAAGFDYKLDLGMYGGLFFTATTADGRDVANLHVVDRDDFQWRWYLAFRDGLRADGELRSAYADLKRNAATAHADDREAYTKAKFDWVLATVSELADSPSDEA